MVKPNPDPLLTIVVPNYNYGRYLKHAIESIFQNPTAMVEVILIDDCSTDNSRDVIKSLIKSHPAIHYFRNERNMGAVGTIKKGCKLAKGKYISVLSSDDYYLPNAFLKVFDFFQVYPDSPLIGSDHVFFNHSKELKIEKTSPLNKNYFFSKDQVYRLLRHTDFRIPAQGVFIKKSILDKHGLYDESLHSACDWYLNHQVALNEGLGYIPGGLAALRLHSSAYSCSLSKGTKRKLWLHLLTLLKIDNEGKLFYKSGIMRILGLRCIYKDLILNPLNWKFLWSIGRKELEKKALKFFRIDRNHYWWKKIIHD